VKPFAGEKQRGVREASMTEEEWLAGEDPEKLLEEGGAKFGPRKLLLFGCTCCRLLKWRFTDPRSWAVVEVAERFADEEATWEELREVASQASATWHRTSSDRTTHAGRVTAMAVGLFGQALLADDLCAAVVLDAVKRLASGVRLGLKRSRGPQANLLRDIFGSPFRPIAVDRAWSTADATSLAQASYDERALPSGHLEPARLAILADALEEAGCTDRDILDHLRGPGPHVRGCWALDLALSRK
jgi:hypothetical protein